MRVTFSNMEKDMPRILIESMTLDYANVIWFLNRKKHIRKLDRIQRATTKVVLSVALLL